MIKNECKDCQHKEICKHREDYETLIRKLDETKAEYEWLTTDYSCDYFKKEECFGHPVADENGNLYKGLNENNLESKKNATLFNNGYISNYGTELPESDDECPCNNCLVKNSNGTCSCQEFLE